LLRNLFSGKIKRDASLPLPLRQSTEFEKLFDHPKTFLLGTHEGTEKNIISR
jgi:hypothetical protein